MSEETKDIAKASTQLERFFDWYNGRVEEGRISVFVDNLITAPFRLAALWIHCGICYYVAVMHRGREEETYEYYSSPRGFFPWRHFYKQRVIK